MSTRPRRFPPPWRVEEEDRGEVLKVLDAKGQILAYVLYEDEPIRRELMKRLTKDEARRIGVNIANLSDLIGAPARTGSELCASIFRRSVPRGAPRAPALERGK